MTYAVELYNVTKAFNNSVAVDNICLQIKDGEFFSILGPSGCGKTTTLRMIAGFESPTKGTLHIKGQSMGDMPAYKRPVNTVFQNYALFPHLTVAKNVAFGLEMRNVPRPEANRRVREALELVRMWDYADRRPYQLSGGQQQRIALARALVNRPAVLLLDEPLGALDLKLRKQMQLELKQMQSQVGITFIYVTHDQEEALTMSDSIAVMRDGKVLQCAAPQEIYETPRSRYVADFIGETNFLNGKLISLNGVAEVLIDDKLPVLASPDADGVSVGQEITVAIRPEKINLYSLSQSVKHESRLTTTNGNLEDTLKSEPYSVVLHASVRDMIYIGTDMRYVLQLTDNSQLVARMQNYGQRYDQHIAKGDEVLVYWTAENAHLLLD
ncbi:MAG: ABC transporter ATP-binding protein [Chloroflexota bacterium]